MLIAFAGSMTARTIAESTGLSATPRTKGAPRAWELLEVGQGGVTRAEVVDGQVHAQHVELLHDLADNRTGPQAHLAGDL